MAHRSKYQARPTLYQGIQMRSRLEADFARHLNDRGSHWEYEPRCFAGPNGQYLPDFGVCLDTDEAGYFEVKPEGVLDKREAVEALRRMEVVFESEPGAHLALVFWRYEEQDEANVEGFQRRGLDDIWWPHVAGGCVEGWLP